MRDQLVERNAGLRVEDHKLTQGRQTKALFLDFCNIVTRRVRQISFVNIYDALSAQPYQVRFENLIKEVNDD
jgi:hypothetical protein